MDRTSARLVNILVGNNDNEAVIEMHFPAPEIVFESECVASIGGADFGAHLGEIPLDNWRSFVAKKGDRLRFSQKLSGNRAYLAIRHGLEIEPWLGSSSTHLSAEIGGYEGRKLRASDRIQLKTVPHETSFRARRIAPSLIPMYRPFPTVRIIPGAEFSQLDAFGRKLIESQDFTITTQSNRMGFRLAGEAIRLMKPFELVSTAVNFGTIQLLPDGQLVILMADHQTAGGYPRIAHVISRDLPLLAQLAANDKVAFHLVDIAHAEDLALEFARDLSFLRVAAGILR